VESLSRWVVRHRVLVGLVWLAITVVGVLLAPSFSGRLVGGTNLSSPAYTANQQIARQYGGAGWLPR
jgi:putative drug exporter of the RND superfamily